MSTLPAEPARQPSGGGSASPAGDPAALARDVRRLADRYRHLSESRLNSPITPDETSDPGATRAAAGLALARLLAALGDAPPGHEVPDLGVFAVGDQIAVTGLDLVARLERTREDKVLDEALHAVRRLAAAL
jgi:hypothetical protein